MKVLRSIDLYSDRKTADLSDSTDFEMETNFHYLYKNNSIYQIML